MKTIAAILAAMSLAGCAGWDVSPSFEYTSKSGESYKATVKIKPPKNSNK